MQKQPISLKLAPENGAPVRPVAAHRAGRAFSCAAILATPFQEHAFAIQPSGSESVLTGVLAVFAGILGLSASLLYRHMHHREEKLARRADTAEAELRALLMMTDEAVLVLSPDGTVHAANPASEELFHRDAGDFVGESLSLLIAQPLALSDLTKHGPVNFETTAKRGEEEFVRVEMLLSPVEIGGGKGYLALIHEARATAPGDREKGGTRIATFEKAIEKFTHDLNNQLTSVLGNLSMILMAQPGDPATHERALNAKKTAVRAQVLSRNLQALVHPENQRTDGSQATSPTGCTIVQMPGAEPPFPVQPVRKPGPSRILILDDEEAIGLLVASALDASGFEVTAATSVGEAVQACQTAMASQAAFSLVICDLSLPGDMDGLQALQKLRAIDPGIKAIVSSGYDSDPVMRDCRRHGFDAAMAKPYEISKLVRVVGEVLNGSAAVLRKTA